MDTARLEALLERATSFAVGETPGPALWKQVERAATAVLLKEQQARRIREFRVKCDAETNAPGLDGVTFEVAVVPPGPSVQRVVVRVRQG